MRQRSYLYLLIVFVLGAISVFAYTRKPYIFGLDIQGGTRFTYKMVVPPEDKAKTAEYATRTLTLLQKRVEGSGGVSEATVQKKGEDQFIIELPGITNLEEAAARIGSSARIAIYDARTVSTEGNPVRLYTEAGEGSPENPEVHFKRQGSDDILKPGDPRYKAMIASWGKPLVVGQQLKAATMLPSGTGYRPGLSFDTKAAEALAAWSRRHLNDGQKLASVLDGKVLSIAPLQKGAVLGAEVEINGQFDAKYVKNLTDLLNGGSLPVELDRISAETIDPTIGKGALDAIVKAGYVAFGLVALFLIAYYSLPGFVALIALGLYVLFTITALKLIGAPFSLAAIAGFILSVGMAVDANILVFERFKEEIKSGVPFQQALKLGFARAFPAILDSNACSIISAVVLMYLGTGAVKGFATTLIIGVAISLFTAVTVTRWLLFFLVEQGIGANPKFYGVERSWFGEKYEAIANEKPLRIVDNGRRWFMITGVFVLLSALFIGMGGLRASVEFKGGYEYVLSLPQSGSNSANAIAQKLEAAGYKGVNVKIGGGGTDNPVAYITLPRESFPPAEASTSGPKVAQAAGLGDAKRLGFNDIGPQVAGETVRNAVLGIVISFIAIVIYLAFRFGAALGSFNHGMRFGISATLAGAKDIFIMFGLAAALGLAFGWEISALFLTALLTVIGFTIHDKIVIFDRVRENLRDPLPNEDVTFLMNRSVSQSLARSINTAMTVIASLIVLIILGTPTPDLKFFCAIMLGGIAWGTYSSIFTAAPVLHWWEKWIEKTKGMDATLLADAKREAKIRRENELAAARASGSRSYGTIKRRSGVIDRSKRTLD